MVYVSLTFWGFLTLYLAKTVLTSISMFFTKLIPVFVVSAVPPFAFISTMFGGLIATAALGVLFVYVGKRFYRDCDVIWGKGK